MTHLHNICEFIVTRVKFKSFYIDLKGFFLLFDDLEEFFWSFVEENKWVGVGSVLLDKN